MEEASEFKGKNISKQKSLISTQIGKEGHINLFIQIDKIGRKSKKIFTKIYLQKIRWLRNDSF
jgi:hypothetical protein